MQTKTPKFFSRHFNDIGSSQLVWLTCLWQLRQAAERTTTWPCALCSQTDHVKIQDVFMMRTIQTKLQCPVYRVPHNYVNLKCRFRLTSEAILWTSEAALWASGSW